MNPIQRAVNEVAATTIFNPLEFQDVLSCKKVYYVKDRSY